MENELTKEEKLRLYRAKWRADNVERRKEYAVKYYNENKEKYQLYNLANKDRIKEYAKQYYLNKKLNKET